MRDSLYRIQEVQMEEADLLYPLASDLRVSLLLCFRCLPDFRTSAPCFRAYAVVRYFGIRVILNLLLLLWSIYLEVRRESCSEEM